MSEERHPASIEGGGPVPPALLRYLLGLEGLALLRGWLGGDDHDARLRVEEIAALLAQPEELAATRPPLELSAREGYAAWAATYDEGANPLITLEEPVVAELLAGAGPGRALDAACGTGRHIPLLVALGHNVVGVDASPEMLALARRRSSEAELRQADLEALPLASDSFDVAVCALALGHLSELGPTVAELARVLRRGGRLVVSVIHPLLSALGGEALFTQPDGGPAFVREATHLHSDYLAAFAASGLAVRRCVEPAWTQPTAAMISKAATRIPGALEQALVGLPCALVWQLQRV